MSAGNELLTASGSDEPGRYALPPGTLPQVRWVPSAASDGPSDRAGWDPPAWRGTDAGGEGEPHPCERN